MILNELEAFEKRHGFRRELGATAVLGGLSLATTAFGGLKQAQALNQESADTTMAASYNASVQENAATQAANFGRENVRRTITAGNRFLSAQRASLGSSGAVGSTGSPLLALAYDAGQARLRALEESQSVSGAYGAGLARANMTRYEGAQQARGLRRRATASLISTGAQLAGQGIQFQQTGVFG